MKKTQKRVPGDVVRIELGDDLHAYARVLEEAMFAFYDARVAEELTVDRIIASPILFQVPVMDYAVKRGRWTVIANIPLDRALLNPPPRFIQDALHKEQFQIYENGKVRPATRYECMGLECEAIWDPSHIEDRLRDHYAGRKNKWLESLRIRE